MTLRITVHPEKPTYNPENIHVYMYKNDRGRYRWQVWEALPNNEKDILGASHVGFVTKERCEKNAEFLLSNMWGADKWTWDID